MGIMVYSLLWVMQDFVHQPYGLIEIYLVWGSIELQQGFRGVLTPRFGWFRE